MPNTDHQNLKVVVFAGGVGGSKMVNGLAQILPPENLTIIANTGDDFEHFGLYICPDLDTIMYTLAGVNNPVTGWGRAEETWQMVDEIAALDGPTWFRLGDKDLANNLLRSHWIRQGYPLTWVTEQLCQRFKVPQKLLPMTDEPVRTIVRTQRGPLSFQEYFVRQRCEPMVTELLYEGTDEVELSKDILSALRLADVIVFAPSNPMLSIDPILALPGLRRLLAASSVPKIAISPIIGANAVKGPAAKLMQELNMEVSPFGVAQHFEDVLTGFMFDTVDERHQIRIEGLGLKTWCTDTMMTSASEQARLAQEVLEFGTSPY